MTQNNNTPVNSSNGPEQIDLLELVLLTCSPLISTPRC